MSAAGHAACNIVGKKLGDRVGQFLGANAAEQFAPHALLVIHAAADHEVIHLVDQALAGAGEDGARKEACTQLRAFRRIDVLIRHIVTVIEGSGDRHSRPPFRSCAHGER